MKKVNLLVVLLFSIFGIYGCNNKSKPEDNEKVSNSYKIDESQSETKDSAKTSSPDESVKSAEKNVIYGQFDKADIESYLSDVSEVSAGAWQGTANSMVTTLGVTHNIVNIVKMDLRNSPLDRELDKNHINELAVQWMKSGSHLVQTISATETKYSDDEGKTYLVRLTINKDGKVSFISVSRDDM